MTMGPLQGPAYGAVDSFIDDPASVSFMCCGDIMVLVETTDQVVLYEIE